jgi:hypothetical protein
VSGVMEKGARTRALKNLKAAAEAVEREPTSAGLSSRLGMPNMPYKRELGQTRSALALWGMSERLMVASLDFSACCTNCGGRVDCSAGI